MTGSVIITMAGLSSRFTDAGFQAPKFMLDVRGRPIFDWALQSLRGFIDRGWGFTFVTREDEAVIQFVKSRSQKLGIALDALVSLRETTRGQAESAIIGARAASSSDSMPLVIFNVDTFVRPESVNSWEVQENDGWIPCFPGQGSSWSFVSIDGTGRARDVAEKRRISKWASVGLYGFRSKELFVNTYSRYMATGYNENQELFVAPLYNVLLAKSHQVLVPKLTRNDVVALGTPSDVRLVDKDFSPPGRVHFA